MLKTISSIVNAIGALNYKGTWNASTNTPTLASGVGTKGDYYVVSVAGSTNLDGETLWGVGDWAVFNGSIWQKVDGGSTGNFTSVNTGTLDVTGNTTLGDASTDTVTVNGYMGIGAAASTDSKLYIVGPATSGTNQYGVQVRASGTSSATGSVRAVFGRADTEAASFTTSAAVSFWSADAIKGAGSTITNQHGVYISDQTQGTNNYGITSLVSSGSNKWNIYASGTANNAFAGNVRIGSTTAPTNALDVTGAMTVSGNTTLGDASTDTVLVNGVLGVGASAGTNRSIYSRPNATLSGTSQNSVEAYITGSSAATSNIRGFIATPETQAASFTCTNVIGFDAQPAIKGAGSTITNAVGLYLQDQTQGTNNYGILSIVSSGANKYNIYASGTANNYFAGNVGIGTAFPGARLDITSSAAFTARFSGPANTYIDVTDGTGTFRAQVISGEPTLSAVGAYPIKFITNSSERMRLDSAGNLSIGTATANAKLHVSGTATGSALVGGIFVNEGLTTGSTVRINFLTGDDGTVRTRAIIEALSPSANSGALTFTTRNSGAFTESMRLDNAGNMGLGTNAPANRLDIVNSASSAQMTIAGSDGMYAGMFGGTGSQGPGIFFLNTAPALRFGTATTKALGSFTELMRLTNGGNLGVGTSSPGQRLDVDGNIQVRSTNSINFFSTGYFIRASTGLELQSADAIRFLTNGANERMRLDSSGNLGLGVTPSAWASGWRALQSLGGNSFYTDSTVSALASNAIYDGAWKYVASSGAGTYQINRNVHTWFNAASGTAGNAITFTTAMTLNASGNLGIGTASPVNKLQVVGSFGRGAPVTKTGNFTLADTENWIICNGTGTITVTLPAASSWTGREFTIKTIAAFTVISNASNVVPLAGGAAGTDILAATAGTWATLVSDGTNWIIMQA